MIRGVKERIEELERTGGHDSDDLVDITGVKYAVYDPRYLWGCGCTHFLVYTMRGIPLNQSAYDYLTDGLSHSLNMFGEDVEAVNLLKPEYDGVMRELIRNYKPLDVDSIPGSHGVYGVYRLVDFTEFKHNRVYKPFNEVARRVCRDIRKRVGLPVLSCGGGGVG